MRLILIKASPCAYPTWGRLDAGNKRASAQDENPAILHQAATTAESIPTPGPPTSASSTRPVRFSRTTMRSPTPRPSSRPLPQLGQPRRGPQVHLHLTAGWPASAPARPSPSSCGPSFTRNRRQDPRVRQPRPLTRSCSPSTPMLSTAPGLSMLCPSPEPPNEGTLEAAARRSQTTLAQDSARPIASAEEEEFTR
jgi:hypothetical protein